MIQISIFLRLENSHIDCLKLSARKNMPFSFYTLLRINQLLIIGMAEDCLRKL